MLVFSFNSRSELFYTNAFSNYDAPLIESVKIMTPFFIFPVNAGDKRGSLSNVARLAL